MNQREEQNVEELLNSFIDGELTRREANEVERLIAHDARIAGRLRELQKSKVLVGSLPRAEAPAEMAEQIKASLETRTLLGRQTEGFDERAGARHLLVRKVLAAAAMIGLVAILAAVVYTIVAPEADYKSSAGTLAFNGRLELKTSNLAAVDAAIKVAIEDNGLTYSSPGSRVGKSVYSLTCSREDLNLLLADLDNIWGRFDSATLFVEAKPPGRRVVVDGVSAKQIVNLITPQKPRVLGGGETIEESTGQAKTKEQVHLTIVVAGSE